MHSSGHSDNKSIQEAIDDKQFQIYLKRQELAQERQREKEKELQKLLKGKKPQNQQQERDSKFSALEDDNKILQLVLEDEKKQEQTFQMLQEQQEKRRQQKLEIKKKEKRIQKKKEKQESNLRESQNFKRQSQKKQSFKLGRDSSESSQSRKNSSDEGELIMKSNIKDRRQTITLNMQNKIQEKQKQLQKGKQQKGKIQDLTNPNQKIDELTPRQSDDYHTSQDSDVNSEDISSVTDSIDSYQKRKLNEQYIIEQEEKKRNIEEFKRYQEQQQQIKKQQQEEDEDFKINSKHKTKEQIKRLEEFENRMKNGKNNKQQQEVSNNNLPQEDEERDCDDISVTSHRYLKHTEDAFKLREEIMQERYFEYEEKVEDLKHLKRSFVQSAVDHEQNKLLPEAKKQKIAIYNRNIALQYLAKEKKKNLQDIVNFCFNKASGNSSAIYINQQQLEVATETFFEYLNLQKPITEDFDDEEVSFIRKIKISNLHENLDIYFQRFLYQDKIYFYQLYSFYQKLLQLMAELYVSVEEQYQKEPPLRQQKYYLDQFQGQQRYGPGY